MGIKKHPKKNKRRGINLNLYDTKIIHCVTCDKCVGEVDYDAEITQPKCGYCVNLIPAGDDKISYTVNSIKNQKILEKLPAAVY